MVFEFKGKVALITGGCSGIGLQIAKELLRNEAKGVTLADINVESGKRALEDIEEEFGINRAIFIQTDVSDLKQFEDSFKETIKNFQHVDILVNNAGIMDEIDFKKTYAVNLHGTVHGITLGLEKYLPEYKQGSEALILNVSSISGLEPYPGLPIYASTKHAIIGLTRSFGAPFYYDKVNVRVNAICPGLTLTPFVLDESRRNVTEECGKIIKELTLTLPSQTPEFVAGEAIKVLKYALNGTIWVIDEGEPVYEYRAPDKATMKHNVIQTE